MEQLTLEEALARVQADETDYRALSQIAVIQLGQIQELKDIVARQGETILRYEKAILRKLHGNRRCRERRKA